MGMKLFILLGLLGGGHGLRWVWRNGFASDLKKDFGESDVNTNPKMSSLDVDSVETLEDSNESSEPVVRHPWVDDRQDGKEEPSSSSSSSSSSGGDSLKSFENIVAGDNPAADLGDNDDSTKPFEELPSGDTEFINRLVKFRQLMYPPGHRLDKLLYKAIAEQSPLIREEERYISWMPIQCHMMNLELRVQRQIVNEGPDKNAVYIMQDRHTDKKYILKVFQKADGYSSEIGFFMVADHPLIVKPVCIERESRGKHRPGLVLEYIPGSLSSLEMARRPSTSVKTLKRMAAQLLNVLIYMHRMGFVHADLKPDNILVRPNGDIVLIDFGYTVPLPYEHPSRGNPRIKAPELAKLINGRLDEALDKWAYGGCLAMWFAHKYMEKYVGRTDKKYTMVRIGHKQKYAFKEVPNELPHDLRQILYLMTAPNTIQRRFQNEATLELLKGMSFFKGTDWDELDKTMSISPRTLTPGTLPVPQPADIPSEK
jgi:hypothetical protein